jgi:hypothetical protein
MSVNQFLAVLAALAAVAAWVGYAEHPTAQNLRRAVIATLTAD